MREYCQIELTQGQIAQVSLEDFEEMSRHKWYAQWSPITRTFYAVRSAPRGPNGKRPSLKMHRQIVGEPAGHIVDHVNGDTLDNRRDNLRFATYSQNNRNARRRLDNKSGFKGVYWHSQQNKWQAWIQSNGRKYFLGLYRNAEDAHIAYRQAAAKHHGEFARVA